MKTLIVKFAIEKKIVSKKNHQIFVVKIFIYFQSKIIHFFPFVVSDSISDKDIFMVNLNNIQKNLKITKNPNFIIFTQNNKKIKKKKNIYSHKK